MLTVHRDLKPPLILSIALIASCLSLPESPGPEHQTQTQTDQGLREAAELDAQDIREADALDALRLELRLEQLTDTDITTGGHCNVRLTECDPYPIGKGKHTRADAYCSSVCLDTIAHCQDYSTAERSSGAARTRTRTTTTPPAGSTPTSTACRAVSRTGPRAARPASIPEPGGRMGASAVRRHDQGRRRPTRIRRRGRLCPRRRADHRHRPRPGSGRPGGQPVARWRSPFRTPHRRRSTAG